MKEVKVRNKVKISRINNGNLTQTQLAKQVGVTRQTMNLIESEKYNPSIKICLLICRELDQPLNQLFWLED
ncbi:helix-turn-helix transcriptional regulator [Halobacillus halophilus]|uniref:helix-turn-helix transcriptional regulator n=1 Tax=Halobacillus halophilus TaxID=1570 RepID=UPI001CD344ED|nr:helix-turn-helix transcriptional regulator [Halobacillus halophilus]MCA1012796.1 helix-turn-helix transcriptional regulator [Halobacillus halophilus]